MSALVYDGWYFIEFINSAPVSQLKVVLAIITPQQIKLISEIAANIQANNLSLHEEEAVSKTFIKYIAKKNNTLAQKKRRISSKQVQLTRMIKGVYPLLRLLIH